MVDRSEGLLYGRGQGYHPLDAQAFRDRLDGYAVVSGLSVSSGSGLEVEVASGEALVGEQTAELDSIETVSLGASDSAHPRKDTIYIGAAGDVGAETGTPREAKPTDDQGNPLDRFETFQPEPPFPPDGTTILAEVWVDAEATSLGSDDVRDRRAPAHARHETVAAKTTRRCVDGLSATTAPEASTSDTDDSTPLALDTGPLDNGHIRCLAFVDGNGDGDWGDYHIRVNNHDGQVYSRVFTDGGTFDSEGNGTSFVVGDWDRDSGFIEFTFKDEREFNLLRGGRSGRKVTRYGRVSGNDASDGIQIETEFDASGYLLVWEEVIE